jgi:hypothetical protein
MIGVQAGVIIFSILLVVAFAIRWFQLRQTDPELMLRVLGSALNQIEELIDRVPLVRRLPFQVRYTSLRITEESLRKMLKSIEGESLVPHQIVLLLIDACELTNKLRRDVLKELPANEEV